MVTTHMFDLPLVFYFHPLVLARHALFQMMLQTTWISNSRATDIIIPDPTPQVFVMFIYRIQLPNHFFIFIISF